MIDKTKKGKKYQKDKSQLMILILLVILLIIINLILFTKEVLQPKIQKQKIKQDVANSSNQSIETKQEVEVARSDDEIVQMLKNSNYTERDRIEYYCGEYFKKLELKEYDSAYNMLYDEFKQKYFPTVEEYEEYVKKIYPEEWALDYVDITRQGDIYVLKLTILDVLGTKETEKSQRIVIRENNYNDFDISFQVI